MSLQKLRNWVRRGRQSPSDRPAEPAKSVDGFASLARKAEAITDSVYRTKLLELPKIISSWVEERLNLDRSQILDFGCGEGTTALGFALGSGARRVVGVDIMPDPNLCAPLAREQLGLTSLPVNLSLHQVSPGTLHNTTDRFDLIYSWSVVEHVDQTLLADTIGLLRRALKPGGLLFVQIAPLYYSSEGSHFYSEVPIRWGHLLLQDDAFRSKLAAATNNFASAISAYETLNRLTAPRLMELIREGGFQILREYTTRDEFDIPSPLLHVYSEDALRTNQFVLLAQRER